MKLQTTQTSPMCRGLLQKRGIEPEWFATDKLKSIKYYGISNTGKVPIKFTKETEQERVLAKNGLARKTLTKPCQRKKKMRTEEGSTASRMKVGAFLLYLISLKKKQHKLWKWRQSSKAKRVSGAKKLSSPHQSSQSVVFGKSVLVMLLWRWSILWMKWTQGLQQKQIVIVTAAQSLLPHNKISSWSIKILKSRSNNGDGIYIEVAPLV